MGGEDEEEDGDRAPLASAPPLIAPPLIARPSSPRAPIIPARVRSDAPIVAKTPVTRFVTDESAWISHVVLCTVRCGETKRPIFFCRTVYGSAVHIARTASAAGRATPRLRNKVAARPVMLSLFDVADEVAT